MPSPRLGYPSHSAPVSYRRGDNYRSLRKREGYPIRRYRLARFANAHGGVPVMPEWYGYRTHCQMAGVSQMGKSKCAEHCIRQHLQSGNPFAVLDWHGTLYEPILKYLAFTRPSWPIVLLNPSDPATIVPFNPFRYRGGDVSAHISRLADTVIKAWGAEDANELPTYLRLMKMLLSFMAYSGEPLHHAAKLLRLPKKELREYAIEKITDDDMKQEWKMLQYLSALKSGFREWKHEILSTENRLDRFTSKSIRLFTGLGGSIDIGTLWDEGAILLANLKPSENLSAESGKVFAALLLGEFLHAAQCRMGHERPYFLYLDECQEYLSPDAAPILDQVLKTGLRLTLIHHHAGELHKTPHLLESIRMSCQIKFAFGGLPPDLAKLTAEEFFLSELNEDWHKQPRVHYLTEHDEEDYFEATTSDHGSWNENPDGEESVGGAVTTSVRSGSRLMPRIERVEDGWEDYGREEKLSSLAERIASLKPRECYVKLGPTVSRWTVPWVDPVLLDPAAVLRFIQTLPHIPLKDAERIIEENERAFLERSREYESRGARPRKKPASLAPQK